MAAVAAVSCSSPGSQPQPAQPSQPPAAANRPAAPATPAGQQTNTFVWGPGWKLSVVPVFSGNPLDSGTGTVTVADWSGGPRKVTYEFPPVMSEAARAEVTRAAAPVLHDTTISGSISVDAADATKPLFSPPLFWGGGAATAKGPLLWFPPEVVAALKTTKTATITVGGLDGTGRKVTLTNSGTGEVVVAINGTKTRLAAMRVTDDDGSVYSLVDALQNPLIIRFRFGAAPTVRGKPVPLARQSGYDIVSIDGPK